MSNTCALVMPLCLIAQTPGSEGAIRHRDDWISDDGCLPSVLAEGFVPLTAQGGQHHEDQQDRRQD